MRVSRLATTLLAMTLGAVPYLAAQQDGAPKGLEVVNNPTRRSGFWASLGLGVGSETFTVPDSLPPPPWLARPTFNMRVGGTPDVHLRLGGELISWYNEEGGLSQTLGGMAGIGQIYPSTTMGFFLKGGGGYAWNSFGDDYYCAWYYCYESGYSYDSGFMWTAGAGWEIPVSRKLNIMPTVDYYEFYFGGRYTANYTEKLWNFGVSVQVP
ncbi:MAG TPA: hypothetical protein PK948_05925 [Gemmatimonadales bacterium]|jgi:hypothetical protein|nr:hypothetical protein [Gemmatimonadales bacterium]